MVWVFDMIEKQPDIVRRKAGSNAAIALCLVVFIAIIMGLTFVKWKSTGPVEGFDHAPRTGLADTAEANE